jgi:hypothetical protein
MCFAVPADALSVMCACECSHMQPVGSRHGWSSGAFSSRGGTRRNGEMTASNGRRPRAGERDATWVERLPIERQL